MSWNLTSTAQLPNTTTGTGTSNPVTAYKILTPLILLVTFLFGLVMNSLYLWVLGFRMNKTVNTTWFFHLILANLVFTFVLFILVIGLLFATQWISVLVLCKIINPLFAVSMYGGIFILTVISLDRYMLVFAPHWHRKHMSPRHATIICMLLWGLSILFSSPYLILQPVPKENSTTLFDIACDLPLNWRGNKHKQYQAKWSLFIVRVLVGYILPFVIIAFCYFRITIKMKTEQMTRSSKPYKIISVKIVSLFVCLLPYYILEGMIVERNYERRTLNVIWILAACFGCFYSCLTPILYLFSIHNFKSIFKNSIVSIIESVFKELSQ